MLPPENGMQYVPRYFFHISDGQFLVDTEGTELAGPAEMRVKAAQSAGDFLKNIGPKFWDGTDWDMYVADQDRKTVLKLRFSAKSTATDTPV